MNVANKTERERERGGEREREREIPAVAELDSSLIFHT